MSGTSANKSGLKTWPKDYLHNKLGSVDCFMNSRVLTLKKSDGARLLSLINPYFVPHSLKLVHLRWGKNPTYHYFQNLSALFLYSLFHLVFFSITTTLYYRVYPNSEKNCWPVVFEDLSKGLRCSVWETESATSLPGFKGWENHHGYFCSSWCGSGW